MDAAGLVLHLVLFILERRQCSQRLHQGRQTIPLLLFLVFSIDFRLQHLLGLVFGIFRIIILGLSDIDLGSISLDELGFAVCHLGSYSILLDRRIRATDAGKSSRVLYILSRRILPLATGRQNARLGVLQPLEEFGDRTKSDSGTLQEGERLEHVYLVDMQLVLYLDARKSRLVCKQGDFISKTFGVAASVTSRKRNS